MIPARVRAELVATATDIDGGRWYHPLIRFSGRKPVRSVRKDKKGGWVRSEDRALFPRLYDYT